MSHARWLSAFAIWLLIFWSRIPYIFYYSDLLGEAIGVLVVSVIFVGMLGWIYDYIKKRSFYTGFKKEPEIKQISNKTSTSTDKMSKVDFYSIPGTFELDRFKDNPNPSQRPLNVKSISSEKLQFTDAWESFRNSYKEIVLGKKDEKARAQK